MDVMKPQGSTMKMMMSRFSQDENHNLAANDIKVDSSFRKLTKNSISFHIWRIDEDRLEPLCKSNYGTFYNDCSYIIYASCPNGTYVNHETITRETKISCNIERYIHFWLGELVTVQKSANVAFKVMELDTYLNNIATQYREAQDNESPRFISYFKDGIFILPGKRDESIADGTRLYLLKGRNSFRCTEMSSISWDCFCSDVIMLLKTPLTIFIWVGRSSHPTERLNGIKVAKKLQTAHNSSEIVIIDDGYEQTMNEEQKQCWNNYLPLNNRFINQTMTIEKPISRSYKLYKCGYVDGKYRIVEIKSSNPLQGDLNDSDSAFILDGFSLGVWVWVGKSAKPIEKTEAMRNARGFMKKKKYPSSTSLIRVIEGHEPLEFIRLFPNWKYIDSMNSKLSHILGKLDSLTLSQRPKMAAQSQLIDDGSGEKRIFRFVAGIQLIELPETKIQWFYTDSSYVVHYTVANISTSNISNGSVDLVGLENIIYIWSGKHATTETIKKSEKFGNDYMKKLNSKSMIIYLEENFETPHFLQLFQGKFIVLLNDNNINNNMNNQNQLKNDNIIIQVRGDCKFNAKSNEVTPMVIMKSKECYVIKSKNIWVWCGHSSTGDCREIAKNVGSIFGDYTLIIESKEPEVFWASVANQITLAKNSNNQIDNAIISNPSVEVFNKPKIQLYLAVIKNGTYSTQEILAFEQSDLKPENIYILDVITIIYIWMGKFCLPTEREKVGKVAENFLLMSPSPRSAKTAIGFVNQGQEPNLFTGFFDSWDRKYWQNHIPYEKYRGHLSKTMCVSPAHVPNQETDFDSHTKYPISVLRADMDSLPSEVDPLRKEVHLTHDDFVALFDMPFSEYNTLPYWKKQELKKKYKLF